MTTPVDPDLAARLGVAEKQWLDECASRLSRKARSDSSSAGLETVGGATSSTSGGDAASSTGEDGGTR